MNEIFLEYKACPSTPKVDMAFINCMSFEKADDVFDRIIEEFNADGNSVEEKLEHLFINRKTMSYVPLHIKLIQIGRTR